VRGLVKLLIAVGVIVGLLAGIDIGVRLFVESQIVQEVESSPELTLTSADASIDSFPFLVKLASSGTVDSFTIDLNGIQDDDLDIEQLSITGDGIQFARDDLMQGTVRVTDVDEATARLTITQEAASEALGVNVVFGPGTVGVDTPAGPVSVSAEVVDGVLSFAAPGIGTLNLDLGLQDYLPCPPSAEAQQGQVVLSCTADVLPPIVLEALNSRAATGA
jgi:hypothetical protein